LNIARASAYYNKITPSYASPTEYETT